jgi:hypothetical protein
LVSLAGLSAKGTKSNSWRNNFEKSSKSLGNHRVKDEFSQYLA